MKLVFRKVHSVLVPTDEAGEKFMSKVMQGDVLFIDIKRPRNIKLHNKWWSLCSYLADHSSQFPDSERASKYMLIQLGYCTWIRGAKGNVPIADSISFSKMDDTEFSALFDKACDLLCEIIPHVTDKNVAQILAEYANVGAFVAEER